MTTRITKAREIQRHWHLFNARGKVLGRAASQIAQLLIGKNKPNFSPHLDNGDWVVVINAQDIMVTGKKRKQKLYHRHSGYPGGLKSFTFAQMMTKDPRKVIRQAVKGMLPKNKLQKRMLKRLRVFKDQNHDYEKKFQA